MPPYTDLLVITPQLPTLSSQNAAFFEDSTGKLKASFGKVRLHTYKFNLFTPTLMTR
jgi:hypothetical protein